MDPPTVASQSHSSIDILKKKKKTFLCGAICLCVQGHGLFFARFNCCWINCRYNADARRVEGELEGYGEECKLETDYIVMAATHIDPKVDAASDSGLEIDEVLLFVTKFFRSWLDVFFVPVVSFIM